MASLVNEALRQSTIFAGLMREIDMRLYSQLLYDVAPHVRIDGTPCLTITWETPWPDFLCAISTPIDPSLADTATSDQAVRAVGIKLRECLRQGELVLSAYSRSQLWC